MEESADHQYLQVENLRKQLATLVTSIQWSYAIFWCPSTEPGALEWGEGHYNGDIKTRKTVVAMEMDGSLDDDDDDDDNDGDDDKKLGSERSDQLRELYYSLLTGESNPKAQRPSATLSPEDLSNTEWYYLLCMSFVFHSGQGLPGRSVTNGQPIWLCNAHCASAEVFSRSLLAKSAGVKTVVCFPILSGVIELGITELVQEDLNIIQHVTSLLEKISSSPKNSFAHFSSEILHGDLTQFMQGGQDIGLVSPSANNSNEFGSTQPTNNTNTLFIECLNGEASQAQSWQLNMDDEMSNCVHNSRTTSSDCISETLVNPENINIAPSKLGDGPNNNDQENIRLLDSLSEDLHYHNVLSTLLKKCSGFPTKYFNNSSSSFNSWRSKRGEKSGELRKGMKSQKMLKQILFEVPQMHMNGVDHSTDMAKEERVRKELRKGDTNEPNMTNHVMAERRRREKVNDRLSVLKSIIPCTTKADKVSILDDTIAYLKELEKRVKELESCKEFAEYERKNKRRLQDMEERTSDNYGEDVNTNIIGSKNKRKACDIMNEGTQECVQFSTIDSSIDNIVTVRMTDRDIFIDMKCPGKEGLLLDIIDAVSNLQLDSHLIQSSTVDGILSLTIKSKLRGSSNLSIGVITQTLQRVLISR